MIIAGPTAVGKTEISVRVAEKIGGEIISADSASVYQGLNIGSAKVAPQVRDRVPHHLIDVVQAGESFSVADFQRLAKSQVDQIAARNHVPIIVGGTGLWIRALLRHYTLPDEAESSGWRDFYQQMGERTGWDCVRRQLRVVDPISYDTIKPQDHRRMIRALEVFKTTGKRLAREPSGASPYQPVYWVLTRSIAELQERIRGRVHDMIRVGLSDEVIDLLKSGVPPRSQSLSAIGYRETVDFLFGYLTDTEREHLIIRHTQQYAKRQLTWFRSEKDARWLDLTVWSLDEAADKIVQSWQNIRPFP